jgi:hypothetical protein
VRADILYQYSFEIVGGPPVSVPVTVNAILAAGGLSVGGDAQWSSFASLCIGNCSGLGSAGAGADSVTITKTDVGASVSVTADSVNHITPTTFNFITTQSLTADHVYLITLYADAHAEVFPVGGGGGANHVYASVDPVVTIDATFAAQGYSVNVSDGAGNSATPLPSTWLMLLSGFVGLGFFAYRGMKKSAVAFAAA